MLLLLRSLNKYNVVDVAVIFSQWCCCCWYHLTNTMLLMLYSQMSLTNAKYNNANDFRYLMVMLYIVLGTVVDFIVELMPCCWIYWNRFCTFVDVIDIFSTVVDVIYIFSPFIDVIEIFSTVVDFIDIFSTVVDVIDIFSPFVDVIDILKGLTGYVR